ncbi:acetyltransferase [Massilia agilis]|uniref:Acetyltransferase n=1 Tax=Massilia agilis TaxID=1811226 RepID=A0ABT2D807_9BURK|nr:acetyltransferase [Massilia agilis]MCS0807446.1 acetyltransferase [Massilia agilis]
MNGVRPLVLLGGGGHGKVLLALAQAAALPVAGVCDPALAAGGIREWFGVPVLGADDALDRLDPGAVSLVNGVGQLPRSSLREQVFAAARAKGFGFPPLVHPMAWVAPGVVLEEGAQVMAGAIVQPGARLGANTVVNTRASVDHDCAVGAHVHIAPGAVLCGGVHVGDHAFVGAGATLIQGVRIGVRAVIGAGALVVSDVDEGALVLGAKGSARPGR